MKNRVMPYKGGWAVVVDEKVKEIFVGEQAEKNAKKRLKELAK